MATALVHPAEALLILTGKQQIVKPWLGNTSRLCSFSKWQYSLILPALCPSQIIDASFVAAYVLAVSGKGASQDQPSMPVTLTP
mmetsp:Transcript_14412/g.20629  ORF Transcript_14412/g.20629 Transcript_14412/m.20629 type:complete len:84 (-) Transcript_14412:656-907(-)